MRTAASGLVTPSTMAFIGPNDFLVLEKNTGAVKRVVNGVVQSKDAAADWALPRVASEHRAVLARARDLLAVAHLGDLRRRLLPGRLQQQPRHGRRRDAFGRGALRAARWIFQKKHGVYDMQDLLGLK